jgi:hypothetical protein
MTHLLYMTIFAVIVSVVFGALSRDTQKARLLYGLKVFAEFMGIGLALAFLLYFIPSS